MHARFIEWLRRLFRKKRYEDVEDEVNCDLDPIECEELEYWEVLEEEELEAMEEDY